MKSLRSNSPHGFRCIGSLAVALFLSFLWMGLASARAQTPWDRFETRLLIEGDTVVRDDTNRGATFDADEPNHAGENGPTVGRSIWYTWRAPRGGVVLVDLAGSDFDTALGLYEGKELARLRILRRNDNAEGGGITSRLAYPVEAGADYQIGIAGVRGTAGNIHFVLRMLARPDFESQPADAIRRYQETHVFQSTAYGIPPLSFQWYFNGVPIQGQAGQLDSFELPLALTLTNLSIVHDGSYSVSVSNANGNSHSRLAKLTVSGEPYFIDQPDSRMEPDGVDIVFRAGVAGRPPISYQWRFNGIDMQGRTEPDLVLTNVQRPNEGLYSIVANNAWGSATSTNATLVVSNTLPRILEQPIGLTNALRTAFGLRVVATGSRIMDYQWFKDGIALPGELSSILSVSSAQITDTGDYFVRISNSRGFTNSATARVKILPPPPNDDFVHATPIQATNYPVLELGYNVGATSEAGEPGHEGTPAAQSVWWKWKAPARGLASVAFTNTAFTPRLGVYTGDSLSTLRDVPYRTPLRLGTLVWLTDPDSDYSLAIDRATELTGDLGFHFHFTTNLAPPVILFPPVDKDQPECETLTLSVMATNLPLDLRYPLTYQWRRNGVPLPGAILPTYTVPNAKTLHSGIYDVLVSNYGGTTTSVTCRCDIRVGPRVYLQPSDQSLRLCDDTDLQVAALGCPPLTYQWLFAGVPLPNATNETLHLSNVDVTAAGNYAAIVTNPDGFTTSRVARVRIDAAPRIATDSLADVTVRECSNHVFQVTMADVRCRPLSYQWYFNRTNALPGAVTNELRLVDVQTNQAGLYSLVISNLYTSTTSRVARLAVSALPLIPADQPADRRRVRLGDSFSLKVEPQSCSPMTYRWLFEGSPILPGIHPLVTVTNIQVTGTNIVTRTQVVATTNVLGGATEVTFVTNVITTPHLVATTNFLRVPMLSGTNRSELVFTQPSTNLSGRYRVEVRNSAGLSVSRDAWIEILVPPPNDHFQDRIPIVGTNAIVLGHDIIATREPGEPRHGDDPAWERSIWWTWTAPDDDGYLTVDLTGSTYDTQLALYQGNELSGLRRLAQDEDSAPSRNARVSGLTMLSGAQVHIAVDGRYNSEGQTRLRLAFDADTHLPAFKIQPRSVAVLPGGTATFQVELERTPRSHFQWQFEGVDLLGETNAVLVVPDVTTNKEGAYVCLASNKYGTTPSQRALLTTGAIVTGMVTDATNKRPIPFARVSVGEGAAEVFTLTDINGNYELAGARPGNLRADFEADRRVVGLLDPIEFQNISTLDGAYLAGTATNYYRYEDRHFRVVSGTIITNHFSMSPRLAGGLRFVLNWGLNPADLDLHVRTPPIHNRTYEIDYRNPYRNNDETPPWAQLDVDETHSFGPETISMSRFVDGTYEVWVQKFDPTASGSLTTSQATLKVYDNNGLIRVIDVPKTGSGLLWHAFNVDGASREIIVVNRVVESLVPGSIVAAPSRVSMPEPASRSRRSKAGLQEVGSQLRYEWTFGDETQTNSLSERLLHRYSRPGVYTVALGMSALVDGSLTQVTTVKTNFITVTNDPPRVRLTSPAARTLFRLHAPLTISAEASDSDGFVSQVAFFANGRPLGTSTQAPFRIEWTPQTADLVTLSAEATDNHGARGVSPPVVVSTRDLDGNVLIVRNALDPEIEAMTALTEEVQCPRGPPLMVRVLDRSELTFDLMSTFKLIIWNHLSGTHAPLSAPEVNLFRQCYDSGIPLYFLGQDLATMAERMDSDAFSAWLDLSRLRPNGPKGGPGTISMPEDLAEHEILHSRYSDFAEFHDGGDLDAARAEPGVDVLLHAGDSPVLLAYPSSDQNSYAVRRITQNFRLLSPGGDPAGDLQRRQLFQSAVSWLIECPQCPLSDLQILSLSASPEEPKAGQELILEAHLTHSGACDPTGVSFSTWIPEGSRLVATSPSNAIRIGNELVFRLGRQPNGFHTNITVTLVPAAAGTLRLRGCLSGSTPDAFASDNCRDWVVPVNPGAIDLPQVLPRLAISRTNGGLRIRVEGASDQPYELQYRDASGSWIPEAISPQTTPSGVSFMVNSTSETRLYRVRVR